jgi:aspartate/methionine/tyrosine aminotransferase
MVSQRARLLAEQGTPPIAAAHFRAQAHPYHPEHRPDGYLNLGTAENRLVWDLLEPRLAGPRRITAQDTHYAPMYGIAALREETAALLARTRSVPVDPQDLVVVGGASAALAIAAAALCDPGDAVIVPAPYYSGFDADLTAHSGARIVPAPGGPGDGFRLSAAAVESAFGRARAAGLNPRVLTLASPTNPIGQVHSAQELRDVLAVAAAYDADVITDELYANGVFGPTAFTGVHALPDSPLPPERVHTVWGFAKDFGLSGFKAGVLFTTNKEVRAAAREMAYFAPVSTDTQALLRDLLADHAWVDAFLVACRSRLRDSYAHLTGLLDEARLPYLPAEAGFSVWTDLRDRLPKPGFKGESLVWQALISEARVSILPGAVFKSPQPGWFRICHTTDPVTVTEAVKRIGRLTEVM